jgi:small subunit ribosomal protein S16
LFGLCDAAHAETTCVACLEEFSLAVKIRLARHGAKKHPYYRVVVADGRMPRDGRYIEEVGRYNPLTTPKTIQLDLEKIDAWVAKGAQTSSTVSHLVDIVRSGAPAPEKVRKPSKKAQAKAAAAAKGGE